MSTRQQTPDHRPPDWTNILFLAFAHVMAIVTVLYLVRVRFSWWTIVLGLLWFLLCGISITGGYHRLFSHGAYRAHKLLEAVYLFFGAAAVQNSAINWCADHRRHHARTDTGEDPYNIRRGFWWAHIGWVLFKDMDRSRDNVKDLLADPLARFQDRHYVAVTVAAGVVLPACLGLIWNDALGALLVAGFLRLVLQWHATFAINSVAHFFGKQTFSREASARDSYWLALLTLGEGYHSFHHRFPVDYRNGVRWYHFDPTKWFVWTSTLVGMASGLRRTSAERIQSKRLS